MTKYEETENEKDNQMGEEMRPPKLSLEIDPGELELLYRQLGEGAKAFANGNVDPEVVHAATGLQIRVKQLFSQQQK